MMLVLCRTKARPKKIARAPRVERAVRERLKKSERVDLMLKLHSSTFVVRFVCINAVKLARLLPAKSSGKILWHRSKKAHVRHID
jgi:hypothetical protein